MARRIGRRGHDLNILFLCTGNSVRSIIAEAVLNELGRGRLIGFSAGNRPTGIIHPAVVSLLERKGYRASGLRSKSWVEFSSPYGPSFDHVITVCNSAAEAPQPVFGGRAARAHWDIPDPSTAKDSRAALERVYAALLAQVGSLVFGCQPQPWPNPAALRATGLAADFEQGA